jgi:hypothetical protein
VAAVSGGILLVLAGIWVGAQILGGDALGRLGISGGKPTGQALVTGTAGQPATWTSGPGINALAGQTADATHRHEEAS